MEKCWDLDPSIRPRVADILVLFETASRGWVSPTSEAIADLSLGLLIGQNPPKTESADTMSQNMFGSTGGGAESPRREAGQSPPTFSG